MSQSREASQCAEKKLGEQGGLKKLTMIEGGEWKQWKKAKQKRTGSIESPVKKFCSLKLESIYSFQWKLLQGRCKALETDHELCDHDEDDFLLPQVGNFASKELQSEILSGERGAECRPDAQKWRSRVISWYVHIKRGAFQKPQNVKINHLRLGGCDTVRCEDGEAQWGVKPETST